MISNQIKTFPLLLGAHMSIAGGMHTSIERAISIGCNTIQVFVKSNAQWRGKPLKQDEVEKFKTLKIKSGISPVMAHDTYLINLCAKDRNILNKSRHTLKDELERCERLGIDYLNFHPGSHMGQGESDGIKLIAESLNNIHDTTRGYKVKSVIETTAGQGTAIGYKFEQIRSIIELIEDKSRMAVCIDTCHIFAAGYDISTEEGWEKTVDAFNKILGIDRLVAFHVNDSKRECGMHVDRHEHIGKGKIGLDGFRFLMNDVRFIGIPKILETPKGVDMKEDVENMRILRSLYQLNFSSGCSKTNRHS
jgi:deoxyribonuclease-4